jgi:hypothetical protein
MKKNPAKPAAAGGPAVASPPSPDKRVPSGAAGDDPWDKWERKAQAAGVPAALAALGRSVMREASQHSWDKRLKMLCGWNDGGRCMIEQALHCPAVMQQRWQRMLDTDGYRGERDPQTGERKSWT